MTKTEYLSDVAFFVEPDVSKVLENAKAAALAAAMKVWIADGKQDCGSAGGAMLSLNSRAKITKAAIAMKLVFKSGSDVWVSAMVPDEVQSQHGLIPQASLRAFKSVLEEAGYGKAIKKFWTYVD